MKFLDWFKNVEGGPYFRCVLRTNEFSDLMDKRVLDFFFGNSTSCHVNTLDHMNFFKFSDPGYRGKKSPKIIV
jgi:hypothetical protein